MESGTASQEKRFPYPLDVYGNPRVRYGKPDIGAVESPYEPGMLLIVR